MGRYALELRMLKRIPARYKKREIWDGDPPGLEPAYGEITNPCDNWHLQAKIRSQYCSMDELKAYLKEACPELVLSPSWSMTGGISPGSDVIVTDACGTRHLVPCAEYEKLKTWHVDERVFEMLELSWSLDLGIHDQDWLAPLLPDYVDISLLRKLVAMRVEFAKKSSPEDRGDRISEAGYTGLTAPDVVGFLADAMAEASSKRCEIYACLVD